MSEPESDVDIGVPVPPPVSVADAAALIAELWGMRGEVSRLPSERDQNFAVASESGRYVLKIANPAEERSMLEAQNLVMARLAEAVPGLMQEALPTRAGERLATAPISGTPHLVRLLDYLPGRPMGDVEWQSPELLQSVGRAVGLIDGALDGFDHPAFHRRFYWDLEHAPAIVAESVGLVSDAALRDQVGRFLEEFQRDVSPRIADLRQGVIHADANDYNLLVSDDRVSGVLDLGDMVWSRLVYDPAIAAAYTMTGKHDPLSAVLEVTAGYHAVHPLTEDELAVLYPLACLRLCQSVCVAAVQQARDPENRYLSVSQERIQPMLAGALEVSARFAGEALRERCQVGAASVGRAKEETLRRRVAVLSPSLSLSYDRPLKIVRGEGAYLFDETGGSFLDCVNNVAHVGHANPRVNAAMSAQAALLNTNARYLHDNIVDYAEALVARLPAPLTACFFMNSGSEANDLALRIARTVTGRRDVITLGGAYHGNSQSDIDVSPYKYNGPGGGGRVADVHEVPMPDPYRGVHRGSTPEAGRAYVREVDDVLARLATEGRAPAAFIAEAIMSCGGQIEPPPGFLEGAFAAVRRAGGICIADEVQIGFGRVGDAFWGFETQAAVPDIVTLGKPIGNGHPMAALITTAEIAAAFANGMEYFSTFGGNPVSCAVGLAVLREIDERGLQEHARVVGGELLTGLRELDSRFVGDARGRGLFLGIELVRDRETREPAATEASYLVNRLRDQGVLLSTDGPDHNVIKIKPPLVFGRREADTLLEKLRVTLPELG